MRSLRGSQLFRRAYVSLTLDQMRRSADLIIAGVLLVTALPLMLFVALAIKWESPGPIFERQACISRGGHRFQMLKFRTMVPDPERTIRSGLASRLRLADSCDTPGLNRSRGSSMCCAAT